MYIKGPTYPLTEKNVLDHAPEEPGIFELWEQCHEIISIEWSHESIRKDVMEFVNRFGGRNQRATHFKFEVTTADKVDDRLGEWLTEYTKLHRLPPPGNDIYRPSRHRPQKPKGRR